MDSNLLNEFSSPWLLGQKLIVNNQTIAVNYYKLAKNSTFFCQLIRSHQLNSFPSSSSSTSSSASASCCSSFQPQLLSEQQQQQPAAHSHLHPHPHQSQQAIHLTICPDQLPQLKLAIQFCHIPTIIEINLENLNCILQTANNYGIESLLNLTKEFIEKNINIKNIWEFYAITTTTPTTTTSNTTSTATTTTTTMINNGLGISQLINSFLTKNIENCSQENGFYLLDKNELVNVLSLDDLNVKSELQTMQFLLQWIQHDWQHRLDCFIEIFSLTIRLEYLNDAECDILFNWIDNFPMEIKTFIQNSIDEIKKLKSTATATMKQKPPRFPHEAILVFGGFVDEQSSSMVFLYDSFCRQWITFDNNSDNHSALAQNANDKLPFSLALPHPLMSYGIIYDEIHKQIYFIGGEIQHNHATQQLLVLHLAHSQWEYKAPMHETRRDHATVLINNNSILAIGGDNNLQVLKSVEKYFPHKNQWIFVAPMLITRSGLAAQTTTAGDCVFAFGGYTKVPMNELTNTCEMYHVDNNQWTFIRSMSQQRYYFHSLNYENRIFVMGGGDDHFWSTVECYHPQTDQWTQAPSLLHVQRADFAACIFQNEFVCLGGGDDVISRADVECWNPTKPESLWCEDKIPLLPVKVWGHRAVTVHGVDILRSYFLQKRPHYQHQHHNQQQQQHEQQQQLQQQQQQQHYSTIQNCRETMESSSLNSTHSLLCHR